MQLEVRKFPRISPLNKVPFIEGYEWLLVSTLRQWVFYSRKRYTTSGRVIPGNGFDKCLIRIGRRVLINLDRFDLWLDQHSVNQVSMEG